MTHRLIDKALGLEPRRGPPVQISDHIGLAAMQLGAQQLGEQLVIAIPVTRQSNGTTNRFSRSIRSNTDAEPEVCSTASHNAPLSRPNTEVCSKKLRMCGG